MSGLKDLAYSGLAQSLAGPIAQDDVGIYPRGMPRWKPPKFEDSKPTYFPGPQSGAVQTVYFPLSELVSGTIEKGVTEATGSPTAGFLAGLVAPSPTQIAKGVFGAAKGGVDDARKIFAGVKAKTADLPKRAVAEKMLAAGEDPAKVWRETGWALGPDGKWRFEISDEGAGVRLSYGGRADEIEYSGKLGGGLQHPGLYAAYPHTRAIQSSIYEGRNIPESGSHSAAGLEYNDYFPQLIASGPDARSPLMHEIQHEVQDLERFAAGGSPTQFKSKAIPSKLKDAAFSRDMAEMFIAGRLEKAGILEFARGKYKGLSAPGVREAAEELATKNKEVAEMLAKYDAKSKLLRKYPTAHEQYQRLAGEAEARLTQHRLPLSMTQRLEQYPYDPEYFKKATGVSLDDLIVRGDDGGVKAMTAKGLEQTAAPYRIGGQANEISASVPTAAVRTLDDNTLAALRKQATGLEHARESGATLYVTKDGRAIISRPKGVKIPETYKRFAERNGLEIETTYWRGPITKSDPMIFPQMPTEYRESGAVYAHESIGKLPP